MTRINNEKIEWLNKNDANEQLKRKNDYLNKVNNTNYKWVNITAEEYLNKHNLTIYQVDGEFYLKDPVNENINEISEGKGILNIGHSIDLLNIDLYIKVKDN